MFLTIYWNLSEISVFTIFFLWKIANLGHFFNEKSLVYVEIVFSKSKFDTNSPIKNKMTHRQSKITCQNRDHTQES